MDFKFPEDICYFHRLLLTLYLMIDWHSHGAGTIDATKKRQIAVIVSAVISEFDSSIKVLVDLLYLSLPQCDYNLNRYNFQPFAGPVKLLHHRSPCSEKWIRLTGRI